MNIGYAIRSIRRQMGITQFQLSEKCAISQTSLSQIENCIKRPSDRTINKVCKVLDVPVSLVYILAIQEADVPASKKDIYDLVFPSIRDLAMQIVSNEHKQYIDRPMRLAV
jgi:transcriptional regulator with XRE-family HTH domain